jgi:hypothetical protein
MTRPDGETYYIVLFVLGLSVICIVALISFFTFAWIKPKRKIQNEPPVLKNYWIEFENPKENDPSQIIVIACGLNAFNTEDALLILTEKMFADHPMPYITKIIENPDMETIIRDIPFTGLQLPRERGIWFPPEIE